MSEPLVLDSKDNYLAIMDTFEENPDRQVYRQYEQINESQYNLVINFLRTSKKDRKVDEKGLVKQLDKLEGETQ